MGKERKLKIKFIHLNCLHEFIFENYNIIILLRGIMGNLHDYLDYCQNLTFEQLPFNELDGVIFSMLPMLDCSISFPKSGSRDFFHCVSRHVRVHELNQLGLIINSDIAKMLYRASKMKRFSSLRIHSFSSIIDQTSETQATGLVVDISDNTSVVVFSGTDDTIVGWKEDFNLMYNDIVPCLEHSLNYLNNVAKSLDNIYIVGHSKGGMEAFFSYSYCDEDIEKKVIKVISYDGPGLSKNIVSNIPKERLNKMTHIIPQGGIVGRLFFSPVEPLIIYSTYRGLQQHDPMSWEISRGKLNFQQVDEFNIQSNLMKQKIDSIINSLNKNQSKQFVHYLFEIISAGGSLTLTEMSRRPHKALKQYLKIPLESRKLITSLILYLAKDKIISRELILGAFGVNQTR